jgi:hypothetical protein
MANVSSNMKKEIKGIQGSIWFMYARIKDSEQQAIADSCEWYASSNGSAINPNSVGVMIDAVQAQQIIDTGDDLRIVVEHGDISFWVRRTVTASFPAAVYQIFVFNSDAEAAVFKLRWL